MKFKPWSPLEEQARRAGVRDPRVLDAVAAVPRWRFMTAAHRAEWYLDRSFEIGEGQTISQPSLVARMTELLAIEPGHRVLEVGAGSGYQAAILARLTREVHGIEIVPVLVHRLKAVLSQLGIENVRVHEGDGAEGWPASAPFDAIVVSCATDGVPAPLLEQLRPGGRLIAPLAAGSASQRLTLIVKRPDGSLDRSEHGDVVFVPLTGPHGAVATGSD